MTELKEELKVRTGEGAVEYAQRTAATLERHHQETGERLRPGSMLPGEGPAETLVRVKVLNEADRIAAAGRDRERERRQGQAARTGPDKQRRTDVGEIGNGYRIKSQERDAQRAVSDFEAAKKRLYRADGSKVYGEEEHAERIGKRAGELREKVEAVAAEALSDATGYEREALALSYTDLASRVPASDRGRMETSRAFVKEDCEALAPGALVERIGAVSAGSDPVAKVLHARYGRMRVEALDAESNRLAQAGTPGGAERAAEGRGLRDAVMALEADLEDPKAMKRAQGLKEAARESRRVAREAKSRLAVADGSDAVARERARAQTVSGF